VVKHWSNHGQIMVKPWSNIMLLTTKHITSNKQQQSRGLDKQRPLRHAAARLRKVLRTHMRMMMFHWK
jgi:hypothetical protein